jgi:annexin A7/11
MGGKKSLPAAPARTKEGAPEYETECYMLRKAMRGLTTNHSVLISVIGTKTYPELQKLIELYKNFCKNDLVRQVSKETRGNFGGFLKALLTEKTKLDAETLKYAIKGWGTDDDCLIDLVCCRTPEEIKAMSDVYQRDFKSDAIKDIEKDVSGDYGRLLTTLLTTDRSKMPPKEQIPQDVKALYDAGEGKIGTDEKVFIRILGTCPRAYAEDLNEEYAKVYGKKLELAIAGETSFNFKKALIALVQPLHEYYAEQLYTSMKGLGTSDRRLIRIIVTQKDSRLRAINKYFLDKYNKTLKFWIDEDTSGSYRVLAKTVVALFGETDAPVVAAAAHEEKKDDKKK